MIYLLKYLTKKEWITVAVTLALVVFQVFLDLTLPDYMSQITELVETPGSEMSEILRTGGRMLLAALGALATALLTALLAARVAASFAANLRLRLFDRVQSFGGEEMRRFGTPSLITRTTNDVLQVQLAAVLGLEVFVKAPILAVWAVVKIASKGAAWSLVATVGTAVLLLLSAGSIALCMPRFRRMQSLADDLGRITRENLSGLHTVRALDGERFEEERFERVNERLTQTHLFTAHTLGMLSPCMQLVNNLLTLGVYFVGMLLINAALPEARVGLFSDTVAILSYVLRVLSAFLLVGAASTLVPRAVVSARRIREVLDTEPLVRDGEISKTPGDRRGEVEFRGVSLFSAGAEEYVLRDISFTVRRGETVGIIGASGSGKSAAVGLIPRFQDVTEGEVLVDGVNVREYTLAALRQKIGFVSQKPFLFRGTLKENVAFGNGGAGTLPRERFVKLLQIVGAGEVIADHKGGSRAHVLEGGGNLSDGEAQRLAIARALCRDPEILIFDDAFSFFDTPTAEGIRRAIREAFPDTTKLIVTQRVVAVRHADRILVMDRGCMLDFGTHEELMARCALYRSMASAQGQGVSE